jgi:transposase InsO family protein
MGSIGDCYDNAVIESFWSRMQVELLDRKRWHTRVELANAIFEYLEIFHNRQRVDVPTSGVEAGVHR